MTTDTRPERAPKGAVRWWIVSVTEKYEVDIRARSRQEAIANMTEHGGSGPVKVTVSVRPARA